MADWKDILSDNDEQLSEKEFLQYLHSNTANDIKHSIEKKSIGDPFDADALQGLAALKNAAVVTSHVKQLNNKLRQLTTKKQRREKREIRITKWITLAILLLLFICIITYFLVTLYQNKHLPL